MVIEDSFPRGSSKRSKKSDFTKNEHQPAAKQKPTVKQKPNGRAVKRKMSVYPVNDSDIHKKMSMVSAELLTYQKIQEGMLILGCVRKIDPLQLEIELPGRVFGKVEAGNLSSAYVNYLEECLRKDTVDETVHAQKLDQLYFIGQILPTKVISIHRKEKTNVFLSIDPCDINAELYPASYKAGMLLWAAVSSKEDRGYVLDVGNPKCKVFLPSDYIPDDTEFGIGETLWCVIKKLNIDSGIAVMHASVLEHEVTKATQNDINLHNCIPGMQFDFTITKILKNGLEGKLSNDNLGYVNEIHLRKPLQHLKKYRVGSTLKARLLYSEPLTKFVFLTFRRIDEYSAPVYSSGTIIPVQIISRTVGGVYVKLPNNDKGFMAEKRFIDSMSANGANKLEKRVETKFREGSTHQCRIICYNPLEMLYICAPDKRTQEELTATTESSIGDLVTVTVTAIVDKGLVVKIGHVQGFIQNIHLGNFEFHENIKKKFQINQRLEVRVWNKNARGIYFTNKQSLVKSDLNFYNYDDAVINKQYLGVVARIKGNGDVLVIFYGDLQGLLRKPRITYFIGQVILITIIEKTPEGGFILSLTPLPPKYINVGEYTNAVVAEIHKDCLIVQAQGNIRAKLPMSHLSCHLSLNPSLLDTYKIGEQLNNLLCIGVEQLPILSLREALIYRDNLEISAYKDLQVGFLLRGSYYSHNDATVNISVPFKPASRIISVPYKDLINDKKISKPRFEPQQPIQLKVVEINNRNDTLKVTGRLSEVYDYDELTSLDHLESYLHHFKRIQNHYKKENKLLADLCIGQRVRCTVKKFDQSGCVVLVNNSTLQGLAHRELCPSEIHVGQRLVCVIVWINYAKNFLNVVIKEDIVRKVSQLQQDAGDQKPLNSVSDATVLMVDNDFVIALLLDQKFNNPLIYLPTFIHENLFDKKMDNFQILERIKVKSCRRRDRFLIGLERGHKHMVKKYLRLKSDNTANYAASSKSANVETQFTRNVTAKVGPYRNSLQQTNILTTENGVQQLKVECNDSSDDESMQIDESDQSNVIEEQPRNFHINGILSKIKDEVSSESTFSSMSKLSKIKDEVSSESTFSSMATYFIDEDERNTHASDSSVEEDIDEPLPKKKKKLSATERAQFAKQSEELIRQKELENANLTGDPQNPEQFDRLLLGNPNSSELWSKYIIYYVVQTEFDKARGIARRALKTIQLNEITERFNIWLVFLQFENNHGDKSTFEAVFEDAVRSNEPLHIYLEVIKMLAESHKFEEMEAKIKKAKNKFKQELKMWISIGNIYFENKMIKEGRNIRSDALKTIQNKKEQLMLLIQFALMEFRFGEVNQGESLFEYILESHPKKTIVWHTYIDQVIKNGDVDKARRIFDRLMDQDIAIRRKKSVFHKYKEFEIKYGTKDTVEQLISKIGERYGIE